MKNYHKIFKFIVIFSALYVVSTINAKGYMAIKNSVGYVNERPTNALGYSTGRPDNTNFISHYGVLTTESDPMLDFSGGYSGDVPKEDEGDVVYARTNPYAHEYEF